jgi:1-acyl-sn-glycerol-3-phosphate acyltransferase
MLAGRMRLFYGVTWLLTRRVLETFFDFESCGMERVPLTGGLLVVSNHASFLDPPIVGAALPRELHYLARRSLFRHPLFGRLIRLYHAIPVELDRPDPGGVRTVLRLLRSGEAVLLFPEGTRTPDGQMGKVRLGAAFIACHAGVPVLPVWISGTYDVLPRHRRLPKVRPIRVTLGVPFRVPSVEEEDARNTRKRLYLETAQLIEEKLLEARKGV